MWKVQHKPLSNKHELLLPLLETGLSNTLNHGKQGIVQYRFWLVLEAGYTDSDWSENVENKLEMGNGKQKEAGVNIVGYVKKT
jgi:hypothetical protein